MSIFLCSQKIEGIILNIIPTSKPSAIHETSRQQPFEVYPNPVSDRLYMKNLPCEVVDYTISNVLGQTVLSGVSRGAISVSGLGKGIYILQIKGEKHHDTAKFVVR